jgi:hypothetical protein
MTLNKQLALYNGVDLRFDPAVVLYVEWMKWMKDKWMDGWINGWIDGWMDKWMDRWMDG